VVFFGTPKTIIKTGSSITGRYLAGELHADRGVAPVTPAKNTPCLHLTGATEHNLKNISVRFPLRHMICVTGVSGSGKSTLVQDVLHAALLQAKGKPTEAPGRHRALTGHEHLTDVVLVDQTPIGRTTRSNPASYVGAYDAIRNLYARAPLARERGYTTGTFSFNSGNGRCPACGGNGFEHV
jgi:excinuclease ABC subunit A